VPVNKWHGDIEDRGEVKRVGRHTFINTDGVVAFGSPDHAHFLIAICDQAAISPYPHRRSLLTTFRL
jgi:mannitol/fructose-specific phosphotransferase system IIA component